MREQDLRLVNYLAKATQLASKGLCIQGLYPGLVPPELGLPVLGITKGKGSG